MTSSASYIKLICEVLERVWLNWSVAPCHKRIVRHQVLIGKSLAAAGLQVTTTQTKLCTGGKTYGRGDTQALLAAMGGGRRAQRLDAGARPLRAALLLLLRLVHVCSHS
jgi:hypothetical protein